jgi:hypothetical protein
MIRSAMTHSEGKTMANECYTKGGPQEPPAYPFPVDEEDGE